ncbi:hypothetical protein RFI_07562 [Reticulomyxa filosa]|uniref:VOC domain-containing protein n=1 Tax=Reticulomyxa filosa TaxID=46433 RepID=X6NU74_RETFI|nr:hypothetical protein RFI_07562 [Reticulomyxa filosa]|eukprot:ETO29561.1 hypothetical protein RFI_07562 [Reticulomyxa filosa]
MSSWFGTNLTILSTPYLEHLNLTTRNIEETKDFLLTAFPHWRIRGQGVIKNSSYSRKWMHVGDDVFYCALESAQSNESVLFRNKIKNLLIHLHTYIIPYSRLPYSDPGINHVGFAVDDIDLLGKRLLKKGYKQGIIAEDHPFRKRIYFYDNCGNEFEFIQYLSSSLIEKNDYYYDTLTAKL